MERMANAFQARRRLTALTAAGEILPGRGGEAILTLGGRQQGSGEDPQGMGHRAEPSVIDGSS